MFAIEGEEEREFDRMAGRTFSEALWELEKKVWNMSWDKTKGLSWSSWSSKEPFTFLLYTIYSVHRKT